MLVLITGGTGLVGSRLTAFLRERGDTVRILSRTRRLDAPVPAFGWDIEAKTIDADALEGVDAVIHLAGTGIADKAWTAARKRDILESRTHSTQLLCTALEARKAAGKPLPRVFVSASAIGLYGDTGSSEIDETAPAGKGFMPDVCAAWEREIFALAAATHIRTVALRIGIVLSTRGGALEQMLPSYRFGIGSYFGDGRGYMSWIHIDDLCRMFLAAIDNSTWESVYNAVAPHPLTGREMGRAVGIGAGKPKAVLLPAPAFALHLALGEMAAVVLNSNRVVAKRATEAGFTWLFEDAGAAVADVVKRGI